MSAPDHSVPVVAIDGPVGSGKGTISSRLAARLGWHLLDSGALYRLVALKALRTGWDGESTEVLLELAAQLDIRFEFNGMTSQALLEAEDVSQVIRQETVGEMASKVASIGDLRKTLVTRQRGFRQPPGLVADGRDMGTVIFPDAPVKIFLTADPETRAQRRYKQLKDKGESVNLSRLFREVEQRDLRDSNRAVAPLRPAEDAIILDSTSMDINEVVQQIYELVENSVLS
jgi:cytidylate kinase